MVINTDITRLDFLQMNLRLWPKIPFNWIFLCFIFLMTLLILAKELTGEIAWRDFVVLAAAISLAMAIVSSAAFFIVCVGINLAFASERTGLGKHEFKLTDEGLHETTRLNHELSKWCGIQRVWKLGPYIILKKHWAALHIFPFRSFESKEQFNEFFVLLSEKIEAGKTQT